MLGRFQVFARFGLFGGRRRASVAAAVNGNQWDFSNADNSGHLYATVGWW